MDIRDIIRQFKLKSGIATKIAIGTGIAMAATSVHPLHSFLQGTSFVATGNPNTLSGALRTYNALEDIQTVNDIWSPIMGLPGFELPQVGVDISQMAHSQLYASLYSGPVPNTNMPLLTQQDLTQPTGPGFPARSSGASQSPDFGNLVFGLYNNRLS